MEIISSFAVTPWWLMALSGALGIGLGYVQTRLLFRAVAREKRRGLLIALKTALWIGPLVGLALYSVPLLLIVTVFATGTMLVCCARGARRGAKE